jgi:lipopolysaccharide export system permease protein
MKILFITSNRLGDAVLSTGLLSWLTKQHPEARITIACGPYASGLFRAVPNLERLIILKKQSWNRHWMGLWRECVETRWDLIVDLRNSIVSRLLRAERKVYGGKHAGQHKVIEHAKVLGISPPPAPHIWLDADAEKEAARIVPADRPILALGPAANWECKQWAIENFAELAKRLTATGGLFAGAAVLVIADEKERTQITPLLRSIPDADRIEVLGRELSVVAACLKHAAFFVGNDSGLMHLAAAVGTPTLGLFGPGYEEIYGPWGTHCAFVRTVESREELLTRLAKSDNKQLNLMRGLSVPRVVEAAKNLLNKIAH